MKGREWLVERIARHRITTMEFKMQNLSLRIKHSFSKINSAFFCPTLFYSTCISTLLKEALKNLKMMLLVHFDDFCTFCTFWWILSFLKLVFQRVYSKFVEEFESTIWTVSKKRKWCGSLDPLLLKMRTCFIVCEVESYQNISKLSCRPLAFTSYKAFLKNKTRFWTSLLASFSA